MTGDEMNWREICLAVNKKANDSHQAVRHIINESEIKCVAASIQPKNLTEGGGSREGGHYPVWMILC